MFELNQEVWCYLDEYTPIVKGKINKTEPYIGNGYNNRRMVMYEVLWDIPNRYFTSNFEECDIYTDEATLRERRNKEAEKEKMESLNEEYELFLNLKESYTNTIKDATFDSEFSTSLEYLQSQIDSGYIDIADTSGDELAFKIITEAFKLYKEKHRLK